MTAVEEKKKLQDISESKDALLNTMINLLESIDEKQNTIIEEVRFLKQTLLSGFQPKTEKPEAKWRLSKSGRSEWIPVGEDPTLAKKLDANGWKSINNYVYRLSEDGQRIIRVRK
jgi:hypothetical protein